MNNPQTLIAALAGAPEIIIGLVREVPPQNLKRRPVRTNGLRTNTPATSRRQTRLTSRGWS